MACITNAISLQIPAIAGNILPYNRDILKMTHKKCIAMIMPLMDKRKKIYFYYPYGSKLMANTCPTLSFIHVLGMKWTIPIIEELYYSREGMQFNEIQVSLRSITARNLSKSLKVLQDESIVVKRRTGAHGDQRIVYLLAQRGKGAEEVVKAIKQAGLSWYGLGQHCTNTKCSTCTAFICGEAQQSSMKEQAILHSR
jgi:DNA-binding HxlR family transcriptional regulator